MRSPILIYATWPWDDDHLEDGAPVEFNIHTRRWYILIRPFSKSQAYDRKRRCWTGVIDANRLHRNGFEKDNFDLDLMVMRHVVVSPENPEIWEILHGAIIDDGYVE